MLSPLSLWTISYVTGIFVGDAVGLTEPAARLLALFALLGVPLAVWQRSGLKPATLMAAGLLGAWAQARQTFSTDDPALRAAYQQATAAHPDQPIEAEGASSAPWLAEGQVASTVERTAAGVTFRLAVDRLGPPQAAPAVAPWVALAPPLAVLVTVSGQGGLPIWPGDRVRLAAGMHEPGGYLNPGGWDRRRHLASLGIQAVASLDSGAMLRLATPFAMPSGSLAARWAWLELAMLRWAAQARAALLVAIERQLLGSRPELAAGASTERSALLAALTLGERGPLLLVDARRDAARQPTIDAIFRAAGIFHILSVSGLHLAVAGWVFYRGLAWLLLFLVPPATSLAAHRMAAAAAIPAVLFYTLLTGAELPTVRAAAAAVLWLLAVACGRRARLAEALAAAVLFIVHPRPGAASALALYEPSLLLSLAATLAIGYLRPLSALLRWSDRRSFGALVKGAMANRWLRALLRTSDASLAAMLATLPLCAAYFAQVQPLGLVGNLLAVPIGELLVLPLGLLGAMVATGWPVLGGPLLAIAGRAAGLMLEVASLLWRLGLSWFVPAPSGIQLALWALGLTGFALRRGALGFGLCFASLGLYIADVSVAKGRLEATFLDVGQGDATVIELPNGGVVVIDAGPGSPHEGGRSVGDTVVAPLLRRRGHRRIELLIASHRHPDHIGGLAALLGQFPVDTLWLPPAAGTAIGGREAAALESAWAQVAAAAARQGTRVRQPQDLTLDGVTLSVVAPCDARAAGGCVLRAQAGWRENDNSLVLRLAYAGRMLLFPGDLELAGELALLEQHDRGTPVAADVLKAPHHCSRTSSSESFIKAVAPTWVVCSVGRNNHFGFPHAEVLRRYREAGSRVLRTDRQGASSVTISADGSMSVGSVDDAGSGWLALHFPLAFRGVRR